MTIRLAGFCMFSRNTKQYKKINATSNFEREDKLTSSSSSYNSTSTSTSTGTSSTGERGNRGIRVMVVVDLKVESAAALQWALSHTLHAHLHSIILLLVINNSSKQGGNYDRELAQKAYQLLCLMKNMCHTKRPGVRVEISVKEGKEKGPTIVEEAKKQRATLLVLGRPRKKSIVLLQLWKIWARKRSHKKAMEYYHYYCIHNANCMTIAVRRKSSKYGGGYLITTKRHQDFWLLA